MRKNYTRILSFVLVLMMVLSLAPVSAFAEEAAEEYVEQTAPVEETPAEEAELEEEAAPAEETPAEEVEPAAEPEEETPAEETPAEPEEPTVPETPAEEPEEPAVPETPAEPEEPAAPETPAEPEEPTVGDDALGVPETPAEEPEEETPAEETEPEENLPAQAFNYRTSDGTEISVDAPEGAFPEGTRMEIKEVKLEDVQKLLDEDDEDEFEGLVVAAVDISFYCGEEKVQPKKDVRVSYTSPAAADAVNPKIIHIDAENELDEIKDVKSEEAAPVRGQMRAMSGAGANAVNNEIERLKLTFDAKSFSVYAIIGEVVIVADEGSFDFETEDYIITVSYTKDAGIPHGTKLVVSEIQDDSDKYWELWKQTILELNGHDLSFNELDPDSRVGLASAVFFDITLITADGREFEPAVPLEVNIHFKRGGLPQFNGEESGVIHFGDRGTEVIRDVQVGDSGLGTYDGMPEGILTDDFTYMQDGFSIVGVYTTDDYQEFGEPVNTSFLPLRAASDNKIASNKSVTDEDGDGIYDLKLSVTGTSNKTQSTTLYKSNIVIVIDVSGSMNNSTPEAYTYNQNTYNQANCYGTYNGNEIRVYHRNGYDGWWRINNNNQWREYTGDVYRYTGPTRLAATKDAANALVTELLKSNQTGVSDKDNIIEISVIKFASLEDNGYSGDWHYNGTEYVIQKSTSETAIHNAINGLTSGGGTNWEAALRLAKTEVDSYPIQTIGLDGKTTVVETNNVIFLTDGLPTLYVNDNGTEGGDGQEGNNNVSTCFDQAYPYADDLVNTAAQDGTDCTFYTIFAYGNGTTGINYLRRLTNYAYDTSSSTNTAENEHCFNATDTTALQEAFKKISDSISSNVGFGGVAISDGLSVGSTNSTIAVDGTVHPEYFVYTVYDTENNNEVLYIVTFDANGTTATFKDKNGLNLTPVTKNSVTTVLPDPTESDPDHTRSVTKDVFSVTVGAGAAAKTYMMTPATVGTDGMIDWDLSGLGILEKWTYELSFKVWPNQAAYDIAADLNNGLYGGDLEAAIADYVTKGLITQTEGDRLKTTMVKDPSTGLYVVSTNYSQDVSYHQATITQKEGEEPVTEYEDPQNDPILPVPNPIPLTGSLIPMEKRWGADLAIVELQELVFGKDNVYTGYKVILNLKRDGVDYMTYTFPKLNADGKPVDKDGVVSTDVTKLVWQQDAAIAPGRLVSDDPGGGTHKTVTLTGKDKDGNDVNQTYYIINDGHEYKIEEEVGSDLHFEFQTDNYHPMLVDGQLMNIKFNSVGANGQITDGSTAEIIDPDMTTVFATNTLKGGLNIRKVVTKEDKTTAVTDCKDEFTFEITLTKDGAAYGTPADQYSTTQPSGEGWSQDTTDPDNPFWYRSGFSAYNIYQRAADGSLKRIARGWIPADGKLTLTMPADGEIRVVNLPSGTVYTVKELVDDSAYHYLKTVSAIKKGENADGSDILDGDSTTVDTNTVSGTIVGNKANLETYWNWAASFYVYHSSDNTIEKISFSDPRVTGAYDSDKNEYSYTFNIVEETKTGNLYGGYYKAYSKAGMAKADILAATYTATGTASRGVYNKAEKPVKTDGMWITDDNGTAYTGDKTTWLYTDAYTALVEESGGGNGLAMNPKSEQVYYLKEVPATKYLQPYFHYTYYKDGGRIANGYLISDVDDVNYTETGFVIVDANKVATLVTSLTVNTEHGGSSIKLTPTIVFKKSAGVTNSTAFLNYREVIKDSGTSRELDNGNTVLQYWTTFDGVIVTGIVSRTYTAVDNKADFANGVENVTVDSTAKKA